MICLDCGGSGRYKNDEECHDCQGTGEIDVGAVPRGHPVTRWPTCPEHPGIRIDRHPCYRCQPEEVDMPATPAMTIEVPVHVQPTLDPVLFPSVRRADVATVKVSVSGTVELTQEQYQAYLDGQKQLGPGAVVDIRAVGYVVQPGAAWVKRTEGSGEDRETYFEREGRVKIRLTELGELTATGEEWSE